MIIYFVETEPADAATFRAAFPDHELHFVSTLDRVGEDVELLSVFINFPIEAAFLAARPRLRYITARSSSVEHIDLQACQNANIAVSNVTDFGDTTVAEHTFALILALSRRLREAMSLPTQPKRFSYEAARGFDLEGKTLGIIGMGPIGERVLHISRAFGLSVIAYDPMGMPPEKAQALGFTWAALDDVLRAAHILSLHVRLSPRTYHILNRETLAKCRHGVLIINTARGRLIETEALREALESGQVGGAGLDVLEQEQALREPASHIISAQIVEHLRADSATPAERHDERLHDLKTIMSSDALLARNNVVFTPHVAFNSVEATRRVLAATIANLNAFLQGAPISLVRPE